MKNSTLIYIEKDGAYLMLHRVKKENDCNRDKWIGIGGKFEDKESPEECVRREAYEETGFHLGRLRYCGIVTFVSDEWETEYMHLFHTCDFSGTPISGDACSEGVLSWVKIEDVPALPIWEGDKIFLRLLSQNVPFFSLKLTYSGDVLTEALLNETKIK